MWKVLAGLGVLVFLAVMMFWLSGGFREKVEPAGAPKAPAPAALQTRPVERGSFPLIIEQVGTLRSKAQTNVSSRIMAQVRQILIREGDEVVGPDNESIPPTLLAYLDSRDIQAKLNQAQAQVAVLDRSIEASKAAVETAQAQLEAAQAKTDQAVADYDRYLQLYQSQAATEQQLEQAKAQKEVAEAQQRAAQQALHTAQLEVERVKAQKIQAEAAVAEAQVMFSFTEIKAPFTGRISRKLVEVGDIVAPGEPLFVLESHAQPEFQAVVSESLIDHLKVGTSLNVYVDALKNTYEGAVREVIPQADPATRTVLVKVSLPRTPLPVSGLFGRLMIQTGSYEALVICRDAVQKVGQLQLVQVLDADGYPRRRFITLGKSHDQFVEVLSGLQEGEAVVVR
ncbi:MAG: hypothetical protein AMJ79_03030 [Phycisphaerae bacterium SM23_30]|nr:MAG: hypothetical protein AMJ79_03030 [Phycisphaerae bacterium SM23_30]